MLHGEHSAILSTFIKLPFVIKIFILSTFEWPFYTGFTVMYVQIPLLIANTDVSSRARGLNFGLSLYLLSYFVYERRQGFESKSHVLSDICLN